MKTRDNRRKTPSDLKAQFDKELEEYRIKCGNEAAEKQYALEHEDDDILDSRDYTGD